MRGAVGVWFTWVDTLEVQEVVFGVNLVELEIQLYHQTRVRVYVTVHGGERES